MTRGKPEAHCLDIVRTALFPVSKWFPFRPDLEKTFYTTSDKDFEQLYLDLRACFPTENFIGMTDSDIITVLNAIRHAAETDALSKFPDFAFDGGFIEHFRVSSSYHNRNGSQQEQFNGQVRRKVEEKKKEWANEDFSGLRTKTFNVEQANCSYQFFTSHFKDLWKDHMRSVDNYGQAYRTGIFMVEYQDHALAMQEIPEDAEAEVPHKIPYRLSRDKQLLNYIYEFRDKLQYVIFVNADRVETIKLAAIPEWKKQIPHPFYIYPLAMQYQQILNHLRFPGEIEQEENHDKT